MENKIGKEIGRAAQTAGLDRVLREASLRK